MQYLLRPAAPEDFDFIYDLYFHTDTNPYLLYEPMSKEDFLPVFQQLLHQKIKYIFETDGVAVGMVKLSPFTFRSGHVCYVGGVAIHSDYTGKGHGFALMEAIKNYATANGFTRLELDADADNPRAKRLYEKAGYVVEGTSKKYSYRKATNKYVDNYRMALLLE